eukprot:SAG31_NODE_668_length_12945_cov_15.915849_8_plen_48_part_00
MKGLRWGAVSRQVMACVQMAAVGTIVLQVCASVFSPYNSYTIIVIIT